MAFTKLNEENKMLKIISKLYRLAGEMACRTNMPSPYLTDLNVPKYVSLKQQLRIVEANAKAYEQCRLWAIAVRDIIDEIKGAGIKTESAIRIRAGLTMISSYTESGRKEEVQALIKVLMEILN
jgi:hypothetical protein